MITEFLCNIFFWLANFFISLFPTFPSFGDLRISQSPMLLAVGEFGRFVDLRVLSTCLLILLVVYNIKFVWSILMWIIRKIPGVS